MKPNIFVSSTIDDLMYERDVVRGVIEDMAFTPVMSDHGEVNYIASDNPINACYRDVTNCDLAIFIIGKRYGSKDQNNGGISVTHNEYRKAIAKDLPIIVFIDQQSINYKHLYDDDCAPDWSKFSKMENPEEVFVFINEVMQDNSPYIAFENAQVLKKHIKEQIAGFIYEKLQETTKTSDMKDILAQIKVIQSLLIDKQSAEVQVDTKKKLITLRYLLNERCDEYKRFLERLFDNIDGALPYVIKNEEFKDVIGQGEHKLKVENKSGDEIFKYMPERVAAFSSNIFGAYCISEDLSTVIMNEKAFKRFSALQLELQSQLANLQ